MKEPFEAFKTELLSNIRKTIKSHRRDGVLAMSRANLMQTVPTPSACPGPIGTNCRWVYRQMFDEAVAALPRGERCFVQHHESILASVLGGSR